MELVIAVVAFVVAVLVGGGAAKDITILEERIRRLEEGRK